MGSSRAARLGCLSLLSCALGALPAVSAHAWVATIGDGAIAAMKLAGATGALLWRNDFDSYDLDLTARGDGVIAGQFTEGVAGLRRFSGATGSPLWETTLSRTLGWVEDVLIDPSGDVLVGGFVYDRYPISDMAIDSSGDVVVGGTMQDGTDCPSFAILELHGTDGSEAWRRVIPGPVTCGSYASLVAVDEAGDVVAGGAVADAYINLFVAKHSGSDGT